jgi:hypothetical protein
MPAARETPNSRNHLKKPYVKEVKTSSNSDWRSFLSYILPDGHHSASPLSTSSVHSSVYGQSIPMHLTGNVKPPPFLDGIMENSSCLDPNNFNPYAGGSSSTSVALGRPTLLKNLWSWVAEMTSEYGNSGSNAECGPSRDQIPHQLGEHAASIDSEMAFAGQMANAEAGPSLGQNRPPLMDFGRMTNAEAGPSYDQNSHHLGDFAAPMQPLSNGAIPYHDDTGDDLWEAKPLVAEWARATFNTEAGPVDYEEDESYHNFRDGLDNPAAVQHVATMLDEMTGLNVATKLAEIRKYDTISDLNDGLNTGHAAECKVEDVEKTSCALRALAPKLLPTPEHPDTVVKVILSPRFKTTSCPQIFAGRLILQGIGQRCSEYGAGI